jgi:hypothetical protein
MPVFVGDCDEPRHVSREGWQCDGMSKFRLAGSLKADREEPAPIRCDTFWPWRMTFCVRMLSPKRSRDRQVYCSQ